MQVEGKRIHLSPGMAVIVEVKTGQRQVIDYLLSPLLKSKQESLRER
jgi:hemolysin D